ncbi:unnamed protein product, partial [Iphiclides podalirius]
MNTEYEENCDVSAIFFDLDNTLIQTRKGDSRTCNKLVEILHHEYGLPRDVASESATTFLRSFRAQPDDESYALDEWPAHLWRNSLPKNFRHIAKNVSEEWLKLRFQYLALTPEVIHLLETLRSVVAQGVTKLGAPRAQHLDQLKAQGRS